MLEYAGPIIVYGVCCYVAGVKVERYLQRRRVKSRVLEALDRAEQRMKEREVGGE